MGRLSGKLALITGGAQGIGRAIAESFSTEGAHVIISDINDSLGQTAAAETGAEYHRLDVRNESDWIAVTDLLLSAHNQINIVVNNAAITGFDETTSGHDPEHLDLDIWRKVLATNLEGVALGCKHAIRAMRSTGGSIINMGSRSGVVGIPGAVAYAASKAAVANHTRSVALYCAENQLNIRCNAIQPASIRTPMWDRILPDPDSEEYAEAESTFLADCPLHRFGTPREVAALAVYLASDESAYTTGTCLNIDGGTLAGTASPTISSKQEHTA